MTRPLGLAVVGIDHRHACGMAEHMIGAGARFVGWWTEGEPGTLAGFVKRFPEAPRFAERAALLADASVDLVLIADVPDRRADRAIEAMEAGKDVIWGDGRLFLLGTEGTIELRKYVDVGGPDGTDHLLLVNGSRCERIDASGAGLPYFGRLARDVAERTESAMAQAHAFKVTELALRAQALAEARSAEARSTEARREPPA